MSANTLFEERHHRRFVRGYAWWVYPLATLIAALLFLAIVMVATGGVQTLRISLANTGMTASQLDAAVRTTGAGVSTVRGLTKVTCILPSPWKAGATITCYGFGAHTQVVGAYTGQVLAPRNGTPNSWVGGWTARP